MTHKKQMQYVIKDFLKTDFHKFLIYAIYVESFYYIRG